MRIRAVKPEQGPRHGRGCGSRCVEGVWGEGAVSRTTRNVRAARR